MSNLEPDPKSKTPSSRDIHHQQAETAILSASHRFRRSQEQANGTTSLGEDQREVLLVIRGMVERLLLSDNMSMVLGRTDLSARFHPDVDMTPYGALDRGVSRAHAKIHTQGRKLYITDLNSTNGTFITGRRLNPNQAELLRTGDEVLLGRLAVQVLFK